MESLADAIDRSEAIVMVEHERRLELKEEGFGTKWPGESQGKTTKLYSFAVDGGLSIRRTVCPLFVVERYSYEEDGRRAANTQSLSRQRGAVRIVVTIVTYIKHFQISATRSYFSQAQINYFIILFILKITNYTFL